MTSLQRYSLGFALSLLMTFVAFALVQLHLNSYHGSPSHELLVPILVLLALAQLAIQLGLFLHVGDESKPRWNLMALLFAFLVVTIVVGGTLVIMGSLSHGQHGVDELFINGQVTPEAQKN